MWLDGKTTLPNIVLNNWNTMAACFLAFLVMYGLFNELPLHWAIQTSCHMEIVTIFYLLTHVLTPAWIDTCISILHISYVRRATFLMPTTYSVACGLELVTMYFMTTVEFHITKAMNIPTSLIKAQNLSLCMGNVLHQLIIMNSKSWS